MLLGFAERAFVEGIAGYLGALRVVDGDRWLAFPIEYVGEFDCTHDHFDEAGFTIVFDAFVKGERVHDGSTVSFRTHPRFAPERERARGASAIRAPLPESHVPTAWQVTERTR